VAVTNGIVGAVDGFTVDSIDVEGVNGDTRE
jgi:hypothetical protein